MKQLLFFMYGVFMICTAFSCRFHSSDAILENQTKDFKNTLPCLENEVSCYKNEVHHLVAQRDSLVKLLQALQASQFSESDIQKTIDDL